VSLDGPGGEFCLFTDRNDVSGFNQNAVACQEIDLRVKIVSVKLRLTILFILDTLVLVSLTYLLLNQLEYGTDLLTVIFLLFGVVLSIASFLILYFKFMKLPVQQKKPKL